MKDHLFTNYEITHTPTLIDTTYMENETEAKARTAHRVVDEIKTKRNENRRRKRFVHG